MPLYLAPQFIAGFLFSRRRHDDVVIPAKAGIQIPYLTGEEIFTQIPKLALDICPQFAYPAH